MDAARAVELALQGRPTIFSPPPPLDPDGLRIRSYVGQAAADVGNAIDAQSGAIRHAMAELLRLAGIRDQREMGAALPADCDHDAYLRATGQPCVYGVEPRDPAGKLAAEALRRAIGRLEALAARPDVRECLAAENEEPGQAVMDAPGDEYVTFAEAVRATGLTSPELSRACRGDVRSIGKHKGKLVHLPDAMRHASDVKARRDAKGRDEPEDPAAIEAQLEAARKEQERAKRRGNYPR